MVIDQKKIATEEFASYIIAKKLLTPPKDTEAFKRGMIDEMGNIIKEPESPEDEMALTLLDKMALYIRKQLGNRVNRLRDFTTIYMSDETQFSDKFILKGTMEDRPQVQKLSKNLTKTLTKG